jgi:hypothetical protein
MTAGMTGFGVLLWVRARASREAAAEELEAEAGARTGRIVLVIAGVLAVLVTLILAFRWRSGGSISLLSAAMPLIGLGWVAVIAARCSRVTSTSVTGSLTDRASRRPAPPERFSPSSTSRPASPEGHISA